jgi:hypothetical protein
MITFKERARRLMWRLGQIANVSKPFKAGPYKACYGSKMPNFWYDPFEVYLLEHIKRAVFILTYNEFYYVDQALETVETNPIFKTKSWDDAGSLFAGEIQMVTLSNGDVAFKNRNGEIEIVSQTPNENL